MKWSWLDRKDRLKHSYKEFFILQISRYFAGIWMQLRRSYILYLHELIMIWHKGPTQAFSWGSLNSFQISRNFAGKYSHIRLPLRRSYILYLHEVYSGIQVITGILRRNFVILSKSHLILMASRVPGTQNSMEAIRIVLLTESPIC